MNFGLIIVPVLGFAVANVWAQAFHEYHVLLALWQWAYFLFGILNGAMKINATLKNNFVQKKMLEKDSCEIMKKERKRRERKSENGKLMSEMGKIERN